MTDTEVKVTRSGGGMPKWAFMKPYHSNVAGKRFLSRFIFFFTPYGGAHITRIHMADDQRKWPHDHSANFVSIKLLGGYEEDVYDNPQDLTSKRHRVHKWLSWHVTPWKAAHSITSVKPVTVTLLLLGRRSNHSSYWTDHGKESLGMTLDLDNDPAEW